MDAGQWSGVDEALDPIEQRLAPMLVASDAGKRRRASKARAGAPDPQRPDADEIGTTSDAHEWKTRGGGVFIFPGRGMGDVVACRLVDRACASAAAASGAEKYLGIDLSIFR